MSEVQRAIFNVIVESKRAFVSPIRIDAEKYEKPPCGSHTDCAECTVYGRRCAGCPATSKYTGSFP